MEFWALRDNIITVTMVILLNKAFIFDMLLCGNNAIASNERMMGGCVSSTPLKYILGS
jgi:hypothetical protein